MARTPRSSAPPPAVSAEVQHGKVKLRRGMGNRGTRKTAADDAAEVARRERRERGANLRVRNRMSFPDIGRELGVTSTQAHRDYQIWLSEQPPSPIAPEVRAEEEPSLQRNLQRIEALIGIAMKQAALLSETKPGGAELQEQSDLIGRLSRQAQRLSESRRKLHGADAPEQKQITGAGGGPVQVVASNVSWSELQALMAENEKAP